MKVVNQAAILLPVKKTATNCSAVNKPIVLEIHWKMSLLLCQLALCVLVIPADIAYCKNPFTDRFHCFDDEEVRDVSQGSIKVSCRLLASQEGCSLCSTPLAHTPGDDPLQPALVVFSLQPLVPMHTSSTLQAHHVYVHARCMHFVPPPCRHVHLRVRACMVHAHIHYFLCTTCYFLCCTRYFLCVTRYFLLHVTSCVLNITSCVLHVTSCVLHNTSCVLHVTFCVLHVTSCVLHVTSCVLHVTSCVLHVTSCVLHVTSCFSLQNASAYFLFYTSVNFKQPRSGTLA